MSSTKTTQRQSVEKNEKTLDLKISTIKNQILKQWLLEQPYSAKLAHVLLSGYGMAEHNTQKLFDEVTSQYEAEVLNAAKNFPKDGLSDKEIFLSGMAAEMLLQESRI